MLSNDVGEILELENVNVSVKGLIKAKDPPALWQTQCKVALLLR
jgi:hypothetical protein